MSEHTEKTLRDEFAMEAMRGMLAARATGSKPQDLARVAYEIADAMMQARRPSDPATEERLRAEERLRSANAANNLTRGLGPASARP